MDALTIAQYFLQKQVGRETEITNMKLQKLLYYAQGFHLAAHETPAFDGDIEAWEFGPVVPDVYRSYRSHEGRPIPPLPYFESTIPDASARLFDDVYEVYGQYSAWRLSEMTHEEAPWKNTPRNKVISHESLAQFFRSRLDGQAG